MYRYPRQPSLGSIDCFYDDGNVVSLDTGPCTSTDATGGNLTQSLPSAANQSTNNLAIQQSPGGAGIPGILILGLVVLLIGGKL